MCACDSCLVVPVGCILQLFLITLVPTILPLCFAVFRDQKLSSGLHKHQAVAWYTDIHEGKLLVDIKVKISEHLKYQILCVLLFYVFYYFIRNKLAQFLTTPYKTISNEKCTKYLI